MVCCHAAQQGQQGLYQAGLLKQDSLQQHIISQTPHSTGPQDSTA
jgi:hypothetical protein